MRVKSMIVPLLNWNRYHRKGSITLEYVVLFPVFIFLSLVAWQLFVVGMALMDTMRQSGMQFGWPPRQAIRIKLKSRERSHSANPTLTS